MVVSKYIFAFSPANWGIYDLNLMCAIFFSKMGGENYHHRSIGFFSLKKNRWTLSPHLTGDPTWPVPFNRDWWATNKFLRNPRMRIWHRDQLFYMIVCTEFVVRVPEKLRCIWKQYCWWKTSYHAVEVGGLCPGWSPFENKYVPYSSSRDLVLDPKWPFWGLKWSLFG